MTTKITADNIEQSTLDILGGSGPAIANVKITSNTYTILDDTAVSTDGGYIIVNGSNFDPNVNILLDGTAATSVTRVSSTQLQAEIPALSAGSKILYVVNTDTGSTTILLNGVTYSGTPTWVTGSTLTDQVSAASISIQLSATSDSNVIYQLQTGSSLPTGLTLAANGLLSGTVTVANDTLYNFTIEATDAENQESPRSFSVTIVLPDEYFRYTTLLLNGDGTNGANNNVFVDSSDNNLPISRVADAGQGSFAPFSTPDGRWSVYFDGTGDYLTAPTGSAFQFAGNFTIEAWVNSSTGIGQTNWSGIFDTRATNVPSATGISVNLNPSGYLNFYVNSTNNLSTVLLGANNWTHVALVRNGSIITLYQNGVSVASMSYSASLTSGYCWIGSLAGPDSLGYWQGYISNLRVVNGTAVYTGDFTPPTAPLEATQSAGTNIAAITGTSTSLLTCRSNRFRDNSSNAFNVIKTGDSKVSAFYPFAPASLYSPVTDGGSLILDGTGDYLEVPSENTNPLDFDTNDWTIEFWYYRTSTAGRTENLFQFSAGPCMLWYGDVIYYQRGPGNSISYAGLGATLPLGARGGWYHYALVRHGGRVTIYVDGKWITGITNESTNFSDVGSLRIGMGNYGVAQGHISNFRIINGTALYTYSDTPSNGVQVFSPPTELLTNVANTELLCNFTNGGIIDRTAKNSIQTSGNAQIDTSVKKYGTGSMKFDGTGDYLVMGGGQADNFAFGTGNFTVEFWLYLNTTSGTPIIYDGRPPSTNGAQPTIYMNGAVITYFTNNANRITGSSLSTSTWYHIGLTRSGTDTKLFVDGTQVGSTYTDSTNYTNATNRPLIGVDSASGNTNFFNGYIDDLRITKGVARYTENFDPPAFAHKLR